MNEFDSLRAVNLPHHKLLEQKNQKTVFVTSKLKLALLNGWTAKRSRLPIGGVLDKRNARSWPKSAHHGRGHPGYLIATPCSQAVSTWTYLCCELTTSEKNRKKSHSEMARTQCEVSICNLHEWSREVPTSLHKISTVVCPEPFNNRMLWMHVQTTWCCGCMFNNMMLYVIRRCDWIVK